ncbi:MAG TPA: alpha-2-macroglobulin family protein, partial [Roseiflexaceae bacterium]|nr:alpha-2-macroglobulin family protein [Roseiflexaceae bacterium]
LQDLRVGHLLRLPAERYTPAGQAIRSRILTIDVEVTDIDGQVIAAQGIVNLHEGAFYIGMRPDGYVATAGHRQAIDLITLDPQGNPIGNRSINATLFAREWYSIREQGADGRLYWTSRYTDTLIERTDLTTDAGGRGRVEFTIPAGGSYRIAAESRDDRGRLIASDSYIWATGDTVFWGVDDTNRIDLIADRTSYAPGDTARVLVTAPYPGMTALITIERGTVVEHRLHTLQGTSELIDIPISAAYTPNVYVGLTLIKPPGNREGDPSVPELRVGLVNLPVTTRERELTVTLTPDRSEYGPRDRVTYTIRTSDHSGAGVRSEVSLALVDKAILTLAADPNPSLIAAFFERRPLGVLQANLLTILVDRVTLRLQEGDKGGGGAAIDGDLRSDFPDTAFWQADLITNERGEAQITIDLPDTLTTWRMTARAVTTDTRVGEAVADIVASRPLLLRPTLPRVLSAGDQPRIQAVVQNTTGSDLNATVRIEASAPIGIQGNTTQQVTVPAGGTTLVHWQASVAEQAGTATISIRAEAGACVMPSLNQYRCSGMSPKRQVPAPAR